jgi:2-dehydropantoate 2-reductase
MKVGIVGPGAMGCLLGGKIARAGNEVILLDHLPDRVDIINQQGLLIEEKEGIVRANVLGTLKPEDLAPAELIINCVKAYDTAIVASLLQNLPPGPFFLTLQNGVGNMEILGERLDPGKILAGITSHGATDLGPGQVRHAGQGDTFIGYGFFLGSHDPSLDPQLKRVKELLDRSGFPTQLVPKIENLIWSKLMINVGINALTALTRLPNGKLLDYAGSEEILEAAVKEGIRVGEEKGIQFVYEDILSQVKKVCRLTASNVSSMLQDVLKQKRTEVDFINGVIMREGRLLGIPVPVNTLLTNLIQTIETSYHDAIREF